MNKSFTPIIEIGLLSNNQLTVNVVNTSVDTHEIIERFFDKFYSKKGVKIIVNNKELIAQ